MSETPATAAPAPVTDHRPVPRGVLPRGAQTWLMAGLAMVMLVIMFATGHREPPVRSTPTAAAAALSPNPDRVRDYQDRLRTLEARANQELQAAAQTRTTAPAVSDPPRTPPAPDPIVEERKRREYESLFASNVALSRRPETQRPDAGRSDGTALAAGAAVRAPATPSIDDIADAAVRASARATGVTSQNSQSSSPAGPANVGARTPAGDSSAQRPAQTDPISDAGPLHRLLEGTLIDTVLTNRLDGSLAAPVNCLVTNPVYSHSGQQILIPAGARILGETKPVQAFGETRLAVAFHRVLMPDGSTFSLDRFPALNQIGDAGLHDQVNQHYWSTFGAAAAVGLISGLAQFVGTAGLATEGNRTVIIAGGAADAAAQASAQTMNRLLNRLPTITIREGHRVKVYLTSDLELPAYQRPTAGSF